MLHRHLNHQEFTLAAIDDVIDRGRRDDWAKLRRVALADGSVMDRIRRVCAAHLHDPHAQRYFFWKHYADRHTA